MPFSPVVTALSSSHAFFTAAKRAQERNKHDVLDELRRKEDDPQFRDKELSLDSSPNNDFSPPKYRLSHVAIVPSSQHRHSPPYACRLSTLFAVVPALPMTSTPSVSSPTAHSQALRSRWMSTFFRDTHNPLALDAPVSILPLVNISSQNFHTRSSQWKQHSPS
ncbi:hypothetical protein ARMSODRAFT_1028175 [Armillaria solidipes]|uniref:Uncharacterized protein n=1 Tax=Armillaria solidipes TaxID=1076256 RepID=A0A2H3AI21_9AGAR|nr:hypothetical protein ARMSODRAFT_1028175 [Armillaria solidipes]